jgi:Uma2 family endonuclease
MNAFAKVDVDTFFRFAAEHPEQRFELERGVIVQQMTGGTRRHSNLARRIANLIENQIDRKLWAVVVERGVAAGTSGRFADVVVEPASEPEDSLKTPNPAVIVEVLSPSTSAIDLNAKVAEYLQLAALDVYIVASQNEPAMQVWQRGLDGIFPAEPVEYDGIDKTLTITGRKFKISLQFAEIYRGIV